MSLALFCNAENCRSIAQTANRIGQNKENACRLNQRQYRTIHRIPWNSCNLMTELHRTGINASTKKQHSTLTLPQAIATGHQKQQVPTSRTRQSTAPTRKCNRLFHRAENLYSCSNVVENRPDRSVPLKIQFSCTEICEIQTSSKSFDDHTKKNVEYCRIASNQNDSSSAITKPQRRAHA